MQYVTLESRLLIKVKLLLKKVNHIVKRNEKYTVSVGNPRITDEDMLLIVRRSIVHAWPVNKKNR